MKKWLNNVRLTMQSIHRGVRMDISSTFEQFIKNLHVTQEEKIRKRYKRITKILNKKYYGIENDTLNSIYVGSYGRDTAIGSTSDIDIIFMLPQNVYTRFNTYEGNGQSALLQEVKKVLLETYSNTAISGDGQVIVISFNDMQFEIVPAFEQKDKSFIFPDTRDGGFWKRTDPRKEIAAINELNNKVSRNLKNLCKMVRAWKNECAVSISGLLIDTLCYNFFYENINKYKNIQFESYHILCEDYFNYLASQDDTKAYWRAPGSNQNVNNEENSFSNKARKTADKIKEAIKKNDNITVNNIWQKVFGSYFPSYIAMMEALSEESQIEIYDNEEFIENKYIVNIKYTLKIDCLITCNGFRPKKLREILSRHIPLNRGRRLKFSITKHNVPKPYTVFWKIRNIGEEAIRRSCLRGQILADMGAEERIENTDFHGPHYVECYIVKDGICVARDRIDVPIC
jgi:hypothetical protein